MLKPPAEDQSSQPPDRPVGELIGRVLEDGKAYAKAELDLAKVIATAKGKALAVPAALIGAALALAREAGDAGDVPVGAIVARGGEVIARAANRTLRDQDPTAHAEVLAIRAASATLGTAYAVWVGIGAALTVGWAMATGVEPSSPLKLLFIAGIVGCAAGLKLLPAAKSAAAPALPPG